MAASYDKSVTDMANLAYWAAHDGSIPALGNGSPNGTPKWATEPGAFTTENREYNPSRFGDLPRPLDVQAGIVIRPVYFCVTAYVGGEKKTEFYKVGEYGADSARVAFQQKYYNYGKRGIRGISVSPLYDLDRRV
jgi:hypothetical protein